MPDVDWPIVAIANLTLHDVDPDGADRTLAAWLTDPASGRVVCTPNVDYVVRCRRDASFRDAVQSCDLRVPDGMWIVYASRLAGRPLRASVTGRLLVPRMASYCRDRGRAIALVGAGPRVAQDAAARLQGDFPGLHVTQTITPPTPFIVGSDEDQAIVQRLAADLPAIIFVALGAPRQELWMARHRDALAPAILIGVGQAFDVLAGRVREAPAWMTRVGLEWAFRLAQEPRRLARRYLVDDPWILWWALRTRLRGGG